MSAFSKLNIIQFFAAINENLYKLLAAYFLIYMLGQQNTDSIMAAIGAVFIAPFLLFSNVGGVLADRLAKNRMVIFTRLAELICLCIALLVFQFQIFWGAYLILFLMATFSAIFGPSKYGIIPELTTPPQFLRSNSIIAAFTFLGIIIGTTLASFVTWATHSHFVIALIASAIFAALGLILSFFLPKTPAKNPNKPVHWFVYGEIIDALKEMNSIPKLLTTSFAYSYFLFIGAFVQLNIIPYTTQVLKFSDVDGGYFFLLSAFGLGIGAYLTDRISKKTIQLRIVPLAGFGISLVLILLSWTSLPWWMVMVWMLLLGFMGGVFLVPSQAYILHASPEINRGRNFATANFFSFSFALLASLFMYVFGTVLTLLPSTSFLIIGIINLFVILFFYRSLHK